MPGTYIKDATETNLLAGMDLATDATSNGTIVQVNAPQFVRFVLTTGTVTGINTVVITGDDTSDFSGTTTRTLGTFNLVAADDDDSYELDTFVDTKYIRVTLTIGTGGDMSASTLYMRPPHYLRKSTDSTTDLL